MDKEALKIHEIFYSIQGESLFVGKPTVFVRVATCNMRCRWCDTRHAFWESKRFTVDDVLREVRKHPTRYVCVTGGEPLGQRATKVLLERLVDEGYVVSLETGGGFFIGEVPDSVVRVIDVKCPDSGEMENMCWDNFGVLRPSDQLKFVIASRKDFDWAINFIDTKNLYEQCTVLMSPVHDVLPSQDLADWVLRSKLPLTFQTQLHKQLWGNQKGV